MDLSNRDTDFAHFDEMYEANEAQQTMIDARVEDYLKDDDSVEQLIADNADVVWSIIKKADKYTQATLLESIKHWARNEVESELNL